MKGADDLNQPVGVWRALGEFKLKEMVPETALALLVGGGGAALVVRATDVADRADVMNEVMALAGAFVAVTFTALALVVSIPSTSYLRMLHETRDGGIRRFLDPFLLGVGVQITVILIALAFRLVAEDVAWWLEHAGFYVLGFLFAFAVLDLAALARQLVRHGILRAVDATIAEEEKEAADVRRLPGRRA